MSSRMQRNRPLTFFSHINKRTQYERPGTSTTMSRYDVLPTTATHKTNGIISNGHQSSPAHQQRQKQPPPLKPPRKAAIHSSPVILNNYVGEMVTTTIMKGPKGLGFTLIGNDASSKGNEFIQVQLYLIPIFVLISGVLNCAA
ncbi:hypothetical protein COOONC_28253, partial [Cooperia oncophora]